MNRLGIVCLLAAIVILAGCGKDPLTEPTGNWSATLTPTQQATEGGATAMAFTVTLSTNASQATTPGYTQSTVTSTNLKFTSSNGCLSETAAQVAGFASDTSSNTFVMTISGSSNTEGILSMQGTLGGESITGTWAMAPVKPPVSGISSCAGSGTFTMRLVSGSPLRKRQ